MFVVVGISRSGLLVFNHDFTFTFYSQENSSAMRAIDLTVFEKLDEYLLTRSYMDGYCLTSSDIEMHDKLSSFEHDLILHENLARWYRHVCATRASAEVAVSTRDMSSLFPLPSVQVILRLCTLFISHL